jgi:hypothetical protein
MLGSNMLHVFTLVLNGSPFIYWHLPMLTMLDYPWHWYVCEGAAMNGGSTKWCQPQQPGLSTDGTHEYLNSIKGHPRVTILQRPSWPSKDSMCNAILSEITSPGTLVQSDSDELFTSYQLCDIARAFELNRNLDRMEFRCRYFYGPNLVVIGGEERNRWERAWRFKPGQVFLSHEPPILSGRKGSHMSPTETAKMGLIMDHHSYSTEAQVAYKEQFYGYHNAVKHWRKLQENPFWPIRDLQEWLPWVPKGTQVDKLYK